MAIETIPQIIAAVSAKTGVTKDEIYSLGRKQRVARARQMAMTLSREFTRFSLPQLGTRFCRDHTTVLTGIRRIGALEQRYPGIAQQMADLRRQLRGDLPPLPPSSKDLRPSREEVIQKAWKATAHLTSVDGSVHG